MGIDDPLDPRIEGFRDIRERDLRGRHGLFVAEGTVVLDALLRSTDFAPVSLLVLQNRLEGIRPLLERLSEGVPVHVASRPVIDAIAGFAMHRGVLALARRTNEPAPGDLLSGAPRRVVLGIGLANHDNVGAILRCAAAFGAAPVLFDETCADPLYRKAIRTSAGAAFSVPHMRGGTADALLDALEERGIAPLALSPRGSSDIRDCPRERAIALVVGAEGPGLPGAVLTRVETARIAMAPGHDSLNVAVATAVALHALAVRPASGGTGGSA